MWHDIWHEEEIYEIMERTVEWITKIIKRKYKEAEEIEHKNFS